VLYSADCLWQGHAATCFGRNQLFPTSIGLSPLDAGHTSDLHINTVNGPPRGFRHASACPRLDRPASGRIRATSRTCIRCAFLSMRTCRFRYGCFLRGISLAANMHSLVRSSKRMLRRRQHSSYNGFAAGSFRVKILSRPNAPSPASFRLFAPPYLGYFSAFGHPTTALSVSRRI
jgi:hypothetical protein